MRNINSLLGCLALAATVSFQSCTSNEVQVKGHWTGTWGTAVQLTEPHNMPPEPGLSQNTIRQRFKTSIGGDSVKLRLSNEFGDKPLQIHSVSIAPALEGGAADLSKSVTLKFSGKENIEIPAGKNIFSDAAAFKTTVREDIAVTIAYGDVPEKLTGHPGSRTTSYILTGNQTSDANFENAVTTDHWYSIERLDVFASENSAAIAILGNSITDGRGSTTNAQNRWADVFAERILNNPATKDLGVLNMGIGGNCVLRGGLGPTGSARFSRDILEQTGVKYVIVFEGVNDMGYSPNPEKTADELIEAYSKMIEQAHAKGLKIYGATVTPFKKSFYHNDQKEECRLKVNDWIRNSGKYDGVIDFEKAVCSKDATNVMDSTLIFENDYLHPNAPGHKKLGEYVDLKLFE